MIEEIWKSVVGFEGLYEVSNMGQIKSCRHKNRKRIISQRKNKTGRLDAEFIKDGKTYIRQTHIIVAEAFIGPAPKDKPLVRHINGDILCNRADNLEYKSKKEVFHLYWYSEKSKDHWLKLRNPTINVTNTL